MEEWQLEFEWLRVRDFVREKLSRTTLPDLNIILLLIGIQELGKPVTGKFTKEEKRDLMHIGCCRLLSEEGDYEYEGQDHDGWPHYKALRPFTLSGASEQETYLKKLIIHYFNKYYIHDQTEFSAS